MVDRAGAIRAAQHGERLSLFLARRARVFAAVDADERRAVVDVFLGLVDGLYTHLPLKRSTYGIDPVQRLRLLRQRCDVLDPLAFHAEIAGVLTELRDAHTRYLGPAALEGWAAMLPFTVEVCGPATRPRYLVSRVAADVSLIDNDEHFRAGVQVLWWNAVPIDRAVDRHADQETGGRPDARRARAIESLTVRALRYGPPPDEQWVIVGYRDTDANGRGVERELRVDWRVVAPRHAATAGHLTSIDGASRGTTGGRVFGIDPAAETRRRVRKMLFAPDQWYADRPSPRAAAPHAVASTPDGQWLPTSMQDAVSAKVVSARGQRLGYLRLWSFDVADDGAYLTEVIRLLDQLPGRGLIIDLRANPGGLIWAAERLLQLFTPHRVHPTRFSLLATGLTREMAAAPQNQDELARWLPSLDDAVANGEPYSRTAPLTVLDPDTEPGQVYGGPVIAVVDANTYSAGDLFAAGFTDNGIGPLISVGVATGAGGANVWLPDQIHDALLGTRFEQQQLPSGIGYTLAVRRATRAARNDGATIEDVGVRGDHTYAMTERDLTGSNQDLIAYAARLLLVQPHTALTVAQREPLVIRSRGIDQIDVAVDGRNLASRSVSGRVTSIEVPAGWRSIEVRGLVDGALNQRRILRADQ